MVNNFKVLLLSNNDFIVSGISDSDMKSDKMFISQTVFNKMNGFIATFGKSGKVPIGEKKLF